MGKLLPLSRKTVREQINISGLLRMNGKTLETPWFSHEDLINGGTLVLEMGENPVKYGAMISSSILKDMVQKG